MVLARDRPKARERLGLGKRRRDSHGFLAADRGRNHRIHEGRARGEAEGREHRLLLVRIRADVARLEGAVVFQFDERHSAATFS